MANPVPLDLPADRTLTVGAVAGLTARLRIAISGMAVAEATQRPSTRCSSIRGTWWRWAKREWRR